MCSILLGSALLASKVLLLQIPIFQAFEHYKVFAPVTIKLNDFNYFFFEFTEQTIR
jgi:hypothetical protein